MRENSRFATRAIHAGQAPDPTTGAIMTPVYQTSTFVQDSPGEPKLGYDYARGSNPTRDALQANLASLEGGRHGVCFSSGLASLAAVVHLLKSGDHVVLSDDVYGGTYRQFNTIFKQLGVSATRVDMTDLNKTADAITDATKLVWLETPSNPMLKIVDIAETSKLAKARGALVAVDNTFATPYLQTPLALGADIVSHSCTKYLGGHSDVIGGALIVNDDGLAERLRYIQNSVGAVPGPWDAFLVLRSTKTLHVRMERHCANAAAVADLLAKSPKVERVLYPGRADHPQHAVAKKQMSGFGGMITATLKGGLDESRRFLQAVRVFSLAESLGGVESLIEHPAIMTHASVAPDARAELGIGDGLVRFSVGIEDVDDLLADVEEALAAV